MMRRDQDELHAIYREVDSIYASLLESAPQSFLESERLALRVLVRLTVEFADDLRVPNAFSKGSEELEFACASIFSGVSSFSTVWFAYKILSRISPSSVAPVQSVESVKETFGSLYRDFKQTHEFERRCRLLLDLFKLQVVFVGLLFADGS
jgi:hypothetical protein